MERSAQCLPRALIAEVHALVRRQILGALQGAVPGQIRRRGEDAQLMWSESARDEATVDHVPNADRHVDALLDQVGDAIAQAQIDRQLGIALAKLRHTHIPAHTEVNEVFWV